MLGKKSRPVIGMLTGSLISGNKSGLVDVAASPRTHHLESKIQSPKGLRSFDFGAVGLGIVAALEKSGDHRIGIPANKALLSRNFSLSKPIPITISNNSSRNSESLEKIDREGMEDEEEYTIVTCHVPNKSYTKVYCDRIPFRIRSSTTKSSVFHISPARSGESAGAPAPDFLSSCHLCRKKLQGEDIYMYRGEKAFCSTECRYRQIVMDERKDTCSSAIDVSGSPYSNGQFFTTGILAI